MEDQVSVDMDTNIRTITVLKAKQVDPTHIVRTATVLRR